MSLCFYSQREPLFNTNLLDKGMHNIGIKLQPRRLPNLEPQYLILKLPFDILCQSCRIFLLMFFKHGDKAALTIATPETVIKPVACSLVNRKGA